MRAIHAHVRGTTADGLPYAADDPALLSWVHASEAFAFLEGFRAYSGVETPGWAQDRYYAEGRRVAAALGAIEMPADRAAMAAYFDAMRPALRYDGRAREVLEVLAQIRLPVPGAAVSRGLFLGAGAALLPPWAQRMLGITALQRARHRACARALRGLAPLFHVALPDGAGARACRRVGVSPSILRTWSQAPTSDG